MTPHNCLALPCSAMPSSSFCTFTRDKFLAAYDKCAYRRCGIEPFDYAALQYWLYELHTSVTVNIYERKVEESRVESNTVSGVIAVPDLAIRAAHYGVRYPPNHLCNSNVGVRRHLSDISSSSSSDSSSSGSSIRIGSDVITRNLAVTKREINPMTGSKGQGMANVSRAPKPAAPIESAGRHTDVVRFLHTAYWEAGWALQTQ